MSMHYQRVPEEEIKTRCQSLMEGLKGAGLNGVFITHPVDLYYFTGSIMNGLLFICREEEPLLLVKKSLVRTQQDSPLKNILPLKSMKQLPEILSPYGLVPSCRLGLTLDVLPAATFLILQNLFPRVFWEDAAPLIRQQRMIKSPYELKLHFQGARLLDTLFCALKEKVVEGREEIAVAVELESLLRREGHHGFIRARSPNLELFMGQLTSGEEAASFSFFDGPVVGQGMSSAVPHGASRKKIRPQEPVVVDYCAQQYGYIVDQTRVLVVGRLPKKLRDANQLALDLLHDFVAHATPGTSTRSLYRRVLKQVQKAGLQEHFMGFGEERSRFLGHGVGLELDEFPIITDALDFTLQEGMVLAVEPKFLFPGEGAVGIENTYYMGGTGLKRFTQTPDDPAYFQIS